MSNLLEITGDDKTLLHDADLRPWRFFSTGFRNSRNPLSKILDADIISWCNIKPEIRYPLIASTIQTISEPNGNGFVWRPITYEIFDRAPDLDAILEKFPDSIIPGLRSGSYADMLEKRSVLFVHLYEHKNNKIRDWARIQTQEFQGRIKRERERESNENCRRNESFE